MDLFSSKIRRAFAVDEYWRLYDHYAHGTLQSLKAPDTDSINYRLAELACAEDKLGFVFDAEKLWLSELSTSASNRSYADWLLLKMTEYVFANRLIWGVYSHNHDLAGQFHDVWSAELKRIPDWAGTQPELQHSSQTESLAESGSGGKASHIELPVNDLLVELNLYGERYSPSSVHLVHAFKHLSNLQYHLIENQQHMWLRLSEVCICSVSVVFSNTASQWLLQYQNEYGSGDELLLDERKLIKPATTPQDVIRHAYLAKQFSNWKPSERGKNSPVPDRIVHAHRGQLGDPLVTEQLGRRAHYSYLSDPDSRCTCGEPSNFYLQFQWGSVEGFIEYQVGDKIRWQGRTFGYKELDRVYVKASSDSTCVHCGHSEKDVFIEIVNNRVVGLKPDVLTSVQHCFQGPFVTDDLIAWEDYQKQWIDEAWSQLIADTNVTEIRQCGAIQWPAFSESAKNESIQYLYLLSKYRAVVSPELFSRSFQHFFKLRFNRIGNITQKTRIESCAILHCDYQGEPCLIKFYWGNLWDFPEYELGNSIQWSEFSVGDKAMEDIVYAQGFIDGAHHIPVLIHIKNNQIAGIHFHVDYSVGEKNAYHYYKNNAYVFYSDQWLPWLNMPGRNYIRSFRVERPEERRPNESGAALATDFRFIAGYQPSEAYLNALS